MHGTIDPMMGLPMHNYAEWSFSVQVHIQPPSIILYAHNVYSNAVSRIVHGPMPNSTAAAHSCRLSEGSCVLRHMSMLVLSWNSKSIAEDMVSSHVQQLTAVFFSGTDLTSSELHATQPDKLLQLCHICCVQRLVMAVVTGHSWSWL